MATLVATALYTPVGRDDVVVFTPRDFPHLSCTTDGNAVLTLTYLFTLNNGTGVGETHLFLLQGAAAEYSTIYLFIFQRHFYFPALRMGGFYPQRASGKAGVTGVHPSPPRYVPLFFVYIRTACTATATLRDASAKI